MEIPKTRVPHSIIRYRGNTNSGDISEFIKNTTEDITSLYAVINDNKEKLKELESIANIENRFLFNRVEYLEQLLKEKDELLNGQNKSITVTAKKCVPNPSNGADISSEYSQITPFRPVYTPKLYMYDSIYGSNIIPPSLNITTTQSIKNLSTGENATIPSEHIITSENDIKNAVDGNSNTCWQRSIKIPATYEVVGVHVDITIPIPYEVISNRYINTIGLCTHPIQGVDIIDVQVKNGNSWQRIEGFIDHSSYNTNTNTIPEARPVRFFFNDMSPSEVKIKLRQTKPILEGQYNSYYIGAYSIEIGYAKYMGLEGQFSTYVDLPGNSHSISSIEGIVDNKSIAGDTFRYEIYYINDLDVPVFVSSFFPIIIPSKKIMILGKVVNTSGVVPALSGIKINYQVLS